MGCKSNQFEGSVIEESLFNNGFEKVDSIPEADFYILNSCTVTHKSDNEAFYLLRNAKHLNPNIKTILTGCIAQVEKEALFEHDFIDFVFGNDEKLHLADFLKNDEKFAVQNIMEQAKFADIILSDTAKTRANVKIQDGCDNRCSYCIIPFARGKSRSADEKFILNQINQLYENDFKEIILTGIHIGQWGLDFDKDIFSLLKFLEENSPIKRIRLGSLNPLEINEKMLDFLSESKTFCPHFHLSLQSACNSTLERMNRFYKVEKYLEQIKYINKKFNLPFIGSDIIAGFAGETDEDFEITVSNLKSSGLTQIHTFPYSVRKNTVAEALPNQVEENVKEYRASVIKQISKIKFREFLDKNLNTTHQVLLEKRFDKNTGFLKGVTENYLKVVLKNEENADLLNTIQNVKIVEIAENVAFGELI